MTYRILITGSRTWTDQGAIWDAITDAIDQATARGEHEFVVVHGACPRGADAHAAAFCEDQSGWYDNAGYTLAEERHPANWASCGPDCRDSHRRPGRGGTTYCRYAGHARNQAMVNLGADICLAFIRDHSRGATDCARRARAAGIPVQEWHA